MKCPICGSVECDEVAEEVDIGVGIEKFTVGFECANCGQIPVCPHCGGVKTHAKWCKELDISI